MRTGAELCGIHLRAIGFGEVTLARLLPAPSALSWALEDQPMEAMLDPVACTLASAPIDDEPVTEEEKLAIAAARESLRRDGGVPFDQVVAELGFTMEEIGNYKEPS